jgi:hypothetical protein
VKVDAHDALVSIRRCFFRRRLVGISQPAQPWFKLG